MECYLGEIKLVPWAVTPTGWLPCDGRTLQIAQNQALYSILGTAYGGDGKTTFNIPNLGGRVIMGTTTTWRTGASNCVGSHGGNASVTLTQDNMPPHTHTLQVSTDLGTSSNFAGNLCAAISSSTDPNPAPNPGPGPNLYAPMTGALTTTYPGQVSMEGAGTAHPNMQPYLVLRYIIATSGNYPPRD